MTISVWRYSHLALAVFSFIFLLIASLTGIILSFEPLNQRLTSKSAQNFGQITLAESLPALRQKYPDITTLTVEKNQSVLVKGNDENGDKLEAYIDPANGDILGRPVKQSDFFKWVTSLHRSLFLHETGRALVGIAAFLLSLITISGLILIIKRQLGVKRFFTKITRDSFAQYYHVWLGRLALIPVLIVALTGAYLSVVRFEFIKKEKKELKVDFDQIKDGPKVKATDIKFFKDTQLSAITSVEFPFSTDVEDYYVVHTENGDFAINQVTCEILAETHIDSPTWWENFSLSTHTGRDSLVWAFVLTLASANILFFIYSGFAITLKRLSGKIRNKYKAKESEIIILVGSESGNTFLFAKAIYKQLLALRQKVHVAQLNDYQYYPEAKHLILFTATYGLGEAPSNAKKFSSLLQKFPQSQSINYAVLGFGSYAYPEFCKFAIDTDHLLAEQKWAKPLIGLHTVADKSLDDFNLWLHQWAQYANISLTALGKDFLQRKEKLNQFSVQFSTETVDDTFVLNVLPKGRLRFQSGDLLAIYPANDHRERLYSIGKIGKAVQLCIKLHENGLGSSFLRQQIKGANFKGKIIVNKHFHFPTTGTDVIMIANGTGIAPFLGMIDANRANTPIHLYCGFRYLSTFKNYDQLLKENLAAGKLKAFHLALSRENNKQYVYDLVKRDAMFFAATLANGGKIMLCGSLAMQKDVFEVLNAACLQYNEQELSDYQAKQQILVDCY